MRIAIIGAGFSGLATAWHLQQRISPTPQITLFDAVGVGGGASGIAAGLIHPFAGAHGKLNWQGKSALEATQKLIEVAESALGKSVIMQKGLLRLAISEKQQADFQKSAKENKDIQWWSNERCQEEVPGIAPKPGLFIPYAWAVDCPLYLEGLWKACQQGGAHLQIHSVSDLKEIEEFDCVIVTAGAFSNLFPELSHLTITQVKGQLLEIEWPEDLPKLPFAVNSQAYVVAGEQSAFIGATYERGFSSVTPDLEVAKAEILPKAKELLPGIGKAKILSCRAGVRASMPGHLPVIKRLNDKLWMLSGMGSKGLLYHAFFAKQLVDSLKQF